VVAAAVSRRIEPASSSTKITTRLGSAGSDTSGATALPGRSRRVCIDRLDVWLAWLQSSPMQQQTEVQEEDRVVIEQILAALTSDRDPLTRYAALTRAQAVHEAVVKRVGAERARAVADMHAAGLSYARIAEVIGFTRARAQQLVERADVPEPADHGGPKVTTHQDSITTFVNGYISQWPRATPFAMYQPLPGSLGVNRYTPETLAQEFFASAEFKALQLGTWLGTPDGELIAAAVHAVTPPPYQQDIDLLVEALKLAAKVQQKDAREKAIVAGIGLAAVGALLATASRS
jgi:hypothetical protein